MLGCPLFSVDGKGQKRTTVGPRAKDKNERRKKKEKA